jgi:Glycerophosphoryl diester phosphodiesterase family
MPETCTVRQSQRALCAALALALAFTSAGARADEPAPAANDNPVPLARAHAHNDYDHARPLLDALDHGFTSIEADVWWVDGVLSVAHDRAQIAPGRTLEALYLKPLLERLHAQHGTLLPGYHRSLQLLVDVKSDAEPSYLALHALLTRYRELLTRFTRSATQPGALRVVVSGNRARELIAQQTLRYAAYDGRSEELEARVNTAFMPLVSDDWNRLFSWQGVGPMPETQRAKLLQWVSSAHARGRRVRLWATPEAAGAREAVWSELIAAGVDYLNTGALDALRTFLLRPDAHDGRRVLPQLSAAAQASDELKRAGHALP